MKTIRLAEIFDVSYGNSYALQDLEIQQGGIAFVSRGSQNNGIVAYVAPTEVSPFSSGCLTVSLGGSVLETFYQPYPFYTAYHIKVLIPKHMMTEKELLYYCMTIRANKYRYNYGRQANKTIENILIPYSLPDYVKESKIPKQPGCESINKNKLNLLDKRWKTFRLSSIFDIEKCKCNNATLLLQEGHEIFYIGAKKVNNGVMSTVKRIEKLVTKGNKIVFIGDGQGSIGYHTYQPCDFIGSTTLTVGFNDSLNCYNALFLVTVLDMMRPFYSFGRKYSKTSIEKSKIKLPVTKKGEPDWEFMENYIKSLPYSKNLEQYEKVK